MNFWETPQFWQIVRDIVIALISAILIILGYDTKVIKPRENAIRSLALSVSRDGRQKKP